MLVFFHVGKWLPVSVAVHRGLDIQKCVALGT